MTEFDDKKTIKDTKTSEIENKNAEVLSGTKKILWECLPLCACMCLNMYISNAPKYTIDSVVADDVQTKFNIVFMPVFVIALLATFIFQPFLKKMGELWANNKLDRLVKDIIKFVGLIVIIDMVITLVGSFIGNPVLGAVYGVDLSDYDTELIIFMIAGGVIALQNLFIMIITTVRYQKYMIYGYIVTAILMFAFGGKVLSEGTLVSLCLFFLGVLCLLTLYCVALITIAINKRKHDIKQNVVDN
jgi:O-antigen/teichoic acid export membrane protein